MEGSIASQLSLRRFRQRFQRLNREFFYRDDIEERAVEIGNIAHEDIAAFVHGDEEVLHVLLEDAGFAAGLLDDMGEDAARTIHGRGQQADIFGEEAEDQLG